MNNHLCQPHYFYPVLDNNEFNNDSELVESNEEYLRRELDSYMNKFNMLEKSMRWWSDCTSNWREKWSKMKSERNKLMDDLIKSQEIIQEKEEENKLLRDTLQRNKSKTNDTMDDSLEEKILFLQEEVKRLSNCLSKAQLELVKINEMSEEKLCRNCLVLLKDKSQKEDNLSSSTEDETEVKHKPVDETRKETSSTVVNLGCASGSSLCVQMGCNCCSVNHGGGYSRSSTILDHLGGSQNDTEDNMEKGEDTEVFNNSNGELIDKEMKTLSKEIEKLLLPGNFDNTDDVKVVQL